MNSVKLIRYYNTLRHLKAKQIYYRIYYFLCSRLHRIIGYSYPESVACEAVCPISFEPLYHPPMSCRGKTFTFINQSHTFDGAIDWNFDGYSKLWKYNLSYFDYLRQAEMSREDGLNLIADFVENMPQIESGMMPFPISLRGVNWIIFLSRHGIDDQKINNALRAQYLKLIKNIEYHILGNHLLENGFSLLFGAYYFRDQKMYKIAKKILLSELDEQILPDGAHFEKSPMYHQLMLLRVLDAVNLLYNNVWQSDTMQEFLSDKAAQMLGWLDAVTYRNGDVPHVNDTAKAIAPDTASLRKYAKLLGIAPQKQKLGASGYRMIRKERYESFVDIGDIGPDYIPGHAHSDTLSFEVVVDNKPVIVDTGLSTYWSAKERNYERSTAAHNTIEINSIDQSHIWGSFRVAERAKVTGISESEDRITAAHDGYLKKFGIRHQREWQFEDQRIIIKDHLDNLNANALSYIHFHPDIPVKIEKNRLLTPFLEITYYNIKSVKCAEYEYALAFNKRVSASVVIAEVEPYSTMEINIK